MIMTVMIEDIENAFINTKMVASFLSVLKMINDIFSTIHNINFNQRRIRYKI